MVRQVYQLAQVSWERRGRGITGNVEFQDQPKKATSRKRETKDWKGGSGGPKGGRRPTSLRTKIAVDDLGQGKKGLELRVV